MVDHPVYPTSTTPEFCKIGRWRFLWLCALICAGWGCAYHRVVRDGWAPLRALGDASPQTATTASTRQPSWIATDKWAILIQRFDGPTGQRQATELIRRLYSQAHLPDLWTRQSAGQTHVYRGTYSSSTDASARSDLRQTRMVKLDDGTSFTSVALVPLGTSPQATASPMDLRQHAGMLSLQIGYYDEAFGSNFRQAAQQAAQALCAQGDPAYYYHGPHRSMVTIGLFTDEDLVQEGFQRVYGPPIRALQKKYPYNLGNGRTLVEKVNGKTVGEQESFLVRVN